MKCVSGTFTHRTDLPGRQIPGFLVRPGRPRLRTFEQPQAGPNLPNYTTRIPTLWKQQSLAQ